jgi:hypothetical protein
MYVPPDTYKQDLDNLESSRPWAVLASSAIKIDKIVMLAVLYDCEGTNIA